MVESYTTTLAMEFVGPVNALMFLDEHRLLAGEGSMLTLFSTTDAAIIRRWSPFEAKS